MKTAKEKTPAAIALEKSQAHLKAAKEKLSKADNAANQNAVKEAMGHVKVNMITVGRERFNDVAGGRITAAQTAMKNLINCATPRSYTFTAKDVDAMEKALTDSLNACISAFRAALSGPGERQQSVGKFRFD